MAEPPRIDTPENWDAVSRGYSEKIAPVLMVDFTDEFVDRLDPDTDMAAVEVAAGSGALTLPLARRVGTLLATDFSPGMIAILEQATRSAGLDNVTCKVMDGMELDVADASMDRAASSFGLMLFPDRARGFRELHRVLRPGGRALVSGWAGPDQFEALGIFVQAIARAFPNLPRPDAPPPVFSLANPDTFRREMQAAGFQDVTVDQVARTQSLPTFDDLWSSLTQGAPPVLALFQRVGPGGQDKLRDTLAAMVEERFHGGPLEFDNVATVGVGHA